MRQLQATHRQQHALRHLLRAFLVGIGQQHHQLFTTITCQQIGAAVQAGLQCCGHRPQAFIALQLTVGVVVTLEAIQVDELHPHGPLTAQTQRTGLLQTLMEIAPVGNAQQRIGTP